MKLWKDLQIHKKNDLYRALWKEHVLEDVYSFLEDYECSVSEEDRELFIDTVATRYVYEGDYDDNLSYWDNIENLVKEERGFSNVTLE